MTKKNSVADPDPDPYVFGPSRPRSGSISQEVPTDPDPSIIKQAVKKP